MSTKACNISEDVWIDYVEGDMDLSFKVDLKRHLSNCKQCRHCLKQTLVVRKAVERQDTRQQIDMPSDAVFARLEARIMEQVEQTIVLPRVPLWRRNSRIVAGAFTAMLVAIVTTFGVMRFYRGGSAVPQTVGWEDQSMVESAQSDPEFFGDVILGHEDNHEMVMESAARRLGKMNEREVQRVLKSM